LYYFSHPNQRSFCPDCDSYRNKCNLFVGYESPFCVVRCDTKLRLSRVGLVVGLITLCGGVVFAGDPTPPTPIVVELFTSEGCSSCPPADALLRKLDSSQPIAGAQLIVLEEHVDYWDDLGWKDPFSSPDWTLRQTEYAQRLNVRAPYTPQIVVNGSVELLGSDSSRAGKVFNQERSLPVVPVRVTEIGMDRGKVHAHVETGEVPAEADVFVALVLEHADTQVKRGENDGRHLEHVDVLQSLDGAGKVQKGQSFSKDVSVSGGKPGFAYRLIAFIQQPAQGKIVGAAVGRLQP